MFKTQDNRIIDIKELSCEDIFPILDTSLPELAKTVHMLPVNIRPKFFKASYRYGAKIIDENGVYLPLANGEEVLCNDSTLPERLKRGLSYDPNFINPVGILLNRTCEFFVQDEQKTVPHAVLQPGETFGLSSVLDNATNQTPKEQAVSIFQWDLIAGARSVFMLSKLAHKRQHIKLQRSYGLTANIPKSYEEQWHVFKDIAHKSDSPWRVEILYFDNKWFDLLKDPKYGAYLFMQLSAMHKLTNRIWHHMTSWDNTYGKIELKKSMADYPLDILFTAKHLFAISAKCAVGFRPANNEDAAPIKLLQDAYVDNYGLEYCPTIMEPAIFCSEKQQPVYYSVNYPTLAQYSPDKNHPGRRVITTLYKVKQVMELYQTNIQRRKDIRAKSLLNAAAKAVFSYYHDDPQDYGSIKNSALLPKEDLRFISKNNCNFPYHSAFLKGLIKISPQPL